MANVFIEESTMSAIGDAIREKTGKSDLIIPSDMPNEIKNIPSGGGESSGIKYGEFVGDGKQIMYIDLPERVTQFILIKRKGYEDLTWENVRTSITKNTVVMCVLYETVGEGFTVYRNTNTGISETGDIAYYHSRNFSARSSNWGYQTDDGKYKLMAPPYNQYENGVTYEYYYI